MSRRSRSRVFFALVLAMAAVYAVLERTETIPTWALTCHVVGVVLTSVATDLLLHYWGPSGSVERR